MTIDESLSAAVESLAAAYTALRQVNAVATPLESMLLHDVLDTVVTVKHRVAAIRNARKQTAKEEYADMFEIASPSTLACIIADIDGLSDQDNDVEVATDEQLRLRELAWSQLVALLGETEADEFVDKALMGNL